MAKDPFSNDAFPNVPGIAPEDIAPQQAGVPPSAPAAKGDITKGSAPKNLLKNAQKWGLFLVCGGLLVWTMIPDDRRPNQKVKEEAPVEIDPTRQASEANNLVKQLKEQAAKAPATTAVDAGQGGAASPADANGKPASSFPGGVAPVVMGSPAPTPMPASNQYPAGQSAAGKTWMPPPQGDMDAMAAKAKRDEEIRAAPLEVQGTIKLRQQGNTQQQGAASDNLTELQEQLAAVDAKRDKASQAQAQLAAQAMAGMNQQPPQTKRRSMHEEFLAQQGEEPYKVLQVQPPVSQVMLQENTVIRAVLLSGISSDLPGKISAMVTSDVYDSIYRRHVVIPKGSTLIGVYSSAVVIGQECMLVAMTRLILPNGNWISLGGAPASNLIGRSGLDADVNNHFWKMFSTSFVLGATSLMLPKGQSTVSTTATAGGNVTTGSAAGLALSDALNNMMQRNKNIAPTLTTKSGIEFMFMVSQDMAMAPYKP